MMKRFSIVDEKQAEKAKEISSKTMMRMSYVYLRLGQLVKQGRSLSVAEKILRLENLSCLALGLDPESSAGVRFA